MKRIFLLLLVSIFTLIGCQSEEQQKVEVQTDEEGKFSLIISTNNQEEIILEEEFTFKGKETLLEAMKKNIEIEETDGFITSIEGIEADSSNKESWFFSINGENSMVGASDYELKDNDVINWDLHKWE